jgi:hypothetical protein
MWSADHTRRGGCADVHTRQERERTRSRRRTKGTCQYLPQPVLPWRRQGGFRGWHELRIDLRGDAARPGASTDHPQCAAQHVVVADALDRVQGVAGGVERLEPQAAGGDVAAQRGARPGVGEQSG